MTEMKRTMTTHTKPLFFSGRIAEVGGATTWENVVCACLTCNVRKGGRTPHEAKMKLVRQPAKPTRNPLLALKLANPKYASWRNWLDGVYWDIGAKD